MLIIAYILGGWVWTNAYVRFLKKIGEQNVVPLIRDNEFVGKIDLTCKERFSLHIKVARNHSKNDLNEIIDSIYYLLTFLSFSTLNFIILYVAIFFLKRVGEAKILCNIQGRLDEMLIITYIVGGWVWKSPKKCLRNIWTVPRKNLYIKQFLASVFCDVIFIF